MKTKTRSKIRKPAGIPEECRKSLDLLVEIESCRGQDKIQFLASRTHEERQLMCNAATALLNLYVSVP